MDQSGLHLPDHVAFVGHPTAQDVHLLHIVQHQFTEPGDLFFRRGEKAAPIEHLLHAVFFVPPGLDLSLDKAQYAFVPFPYPQMVDQHAELRTAKAGDHTGGIVNQGLMDQLGGPIRILFAFGFGQRPHPKYLSVYFIHHLKQKVDFFLFHISK